MKLKKIRFRIFRTIYVCRQMKVDSRGSGRPAASIHFHLTTYTHQMHQGKRKPNLRRAPLRWYLYKKMRYGNVQNEATVARAYFGDFNSCPTQSVAFALSSLSTRRQCQRSQNREISRPLSFKNRIGCCTNHGSIFIHTF